MQKFDTEELKFEIEVPQLLLHSRNIILHGDIDATMSKRICEDLLALDQINNTPIGIWISTTGGSVGQGWAIIDIIFGLSSPVYTFICGQAGSMGAIIALAGERRVMTENSTWMFHDLYTGGCDGIKGNEIIARSENYYKKMQIHTENFIKERTNLTDDDLTKARHGELWLWANECKKKGIIHVIAKKNKGK